MALRTCSGARVPRVGVTRQGVALTRQGGALAVKTTLFRFKVPQMPLKAPPQKLIVGAKETYMRKELF